MGELEQLGEEACWTSDAFTTREGGSGVGCNVFALLGGPGTSSGSGRGNTRNCSTRARRPPATLAPTPTARTTPQSSIAVSYNTYSNTLTTPALSPLTTHLNGRSTTASAVIAS